MHTQVHNCLKNKKTDPLRNYIRDVCVCEVKSCHLFATETNII